jgi:hypothetical protein
MTNISFGPNALKKYPTTYFRRTFSVTKLNTRKCVPQFGWG